MEKKHYNYGIMNGDTVKLFNDSIIDFSPLHDVALEDVYVEFRYNGLLKIDAKRVITVNHFSNKT